MSVLPFPPTVLPSHHCFCTWRWEQGEKTSIKTFEYWVWFFFSTDWQCEAVWARTSQSHHTMTAMAEIWLRDWLCLWLCLPRAPHPTTLEAFETTLVHMESEWVYKKTWTDNTSILCLLFRKFFLMFESIFLLKVPFLDYMGFNSIAVWCCKHLHSSLMMVANLCDNLW